MGTLLVSVFMSYAGVSGASVGAVRVSFSRVARVDNRGKQVIGLRASSGSLLCSVYGFGIRGSAFIIRSHGFLCTFSSANSFVNDVSRGKRTKGRCGRVSGIFFRSNAIKMCSFDGDTVLQFGLGGRLLSARGYGVTRTSVEPFRMCP